LRSLVKLIGSGFGSGYFPVASGTAGSAVALLIWIILPEMSPFGQFLFIVVSLLVGVPVCTAMEREYGSDPRQAVWDEFAGQWTALFLLPKTAPLMVASFLIFRVLDIWKPFPARRSQDLPGGWGVMVDDLIVGIYTVLLLHFWLILFP
jgi:phosphatidylglycerophosphatase A